jgi:hypothetical protein
MQMRVLQGIAGLIVGVAGVQAASASVCDKVLQDGVFREEKVITDQKFGQEFLEYVCNSNEDYRNSARRIGVRVPLKKIPIFGNYVKEDDSFSKAEACKSVQKKDQRSFGEDLQRRYGDQSVLDAWKFCVKTTVDAGSTGLVCTATAEPDSDEVVTIALSWRPTDARQAVKASLQALDVACGGTDSFQLAPFESRILLCKRAKPRVAATVIVNTDAAGTSCKMAIAKMADPKSPEACLQKVVERYGAGEPKSPPHATSQRCCQMQMQFRSDLEIAEASVKQWGECVAIFDKGNDALGKSCIIAVRPVIPGFNLPEPSAAIARLGLKESTDRANLVRAEVRSNPADYCVK